ncbi:MAG: inositol monophosphatase [Thermoguttaceae bacterium]|nr:inositol monophosphatase [Thermoguttaceae bacterium]
MNLHEYLDAAVDAARAAGLIMRSKAGRTSFREKGWADLVTETDVACQREITRILLDRFPETWIVGEEAVPGTRFLSESRCGSQAPPDRPLTWIVDPIDGTTNFVHGVPMFGPSIGLARGNDLLCGVFFNPCADELFTAVKGEGACLNGETIRASDVTRLDRALATVSFPTRTLFDSPDYLAFQEMVRSCQAIRRSGSTALNLAYLAAGRFDVLSCQNAHAWDSAAGVILVREAGGVISAPDGSEVDLAHAGVIAAATPELYRAFRQAISRRGVQ